MLKKPFSLTGRTLVLILGTLIVTLILVLNRTKPQQRPQPFANQHLPPTMSSLDRDTLNIPEPSDEYRHQTPPRPSQNSVRATEIKNSPLRPDHAQNIRFEISTGSGPNQWIAQMTLHDVPFENIQWVIRESNLQWSYVQGMSPRLPTPLPTRFPSHQHGSCEDSIRIMGAAYKSIDFEFSHYEWAWTFRGQFVACASYRVDFVDEAGNGKMEFWCLDPESGVLRKRKTRMRHS